LGLVVALCSTLAATGTANAAPMDFALSRFGTAAGDVGCSGEPGHFCADQALFERLMLQFGTAMTLPSATSAVSLGVGGFYVGVDTTITSIDSDQAQWQRGTEGDVRSAALGENPDVSSTLVWNRVQLRKGLPFGLEIDGSLAQAASTQAWLVGVGLKWSLVEGFRTGYGRFPDVAIRAALSAATGTPGSSLTVVSVDLVLSKPFVFDQAWSITPTVALQGGWLYADSDFVDLTPDIDAFYQCSPSPGHQLPTPTTAAATVACRRGSADYANTVVFNSFRRFNTRLNVGAELRYRHFLTRALVAYDLLAPSIDVGNDPDERMSRQLSLNLGVGIAF